MTGASPPSSPPHSSLPTTYKDGTSFVPEDFRLDSLLDDPLLFDKDLFSFDNLPLIPTIAPLHNPLPAQLLQRPHPVEPGADTAKLLSNTSTARSAPATSRYRAKGPAGVSIKEVLNNDESSSLTNGLDALPGTENAESSRRLTNTRKRRRTDSNSSPSQRLSLASNVTAGKASHATTSTNLDYVTDFDFLHLPAPPLQHRRQQSQDELPRIPPLLQGLHEPPPDAGLFPRITENAFAADSRDETNNAQRRILPSARMTTLPSASNATPILPNISPKPVLPVKANHSHREDSSNISALVSSGQEVSRHLKKHSLVTTVRTKSDLVNPEFQEPVKSLTGEKIAKGSTELSTQAKKSQRTGRARRRWSDEEVANLLAGVSMFGIGRWKKILAHPDFTFHGRSAVDLKDRFRVCCPGVYSQSAVERAVASLNTKKVPAKDVKKTKEVRDGQKENAKIPTSTRKQDLDPSSLTNILAPDDAGEAKETSPDSSPVFFPKSKEISTTENPSQHNAQTTLSHFPVSTHRKRHPFTPAEDAAILHGVAEHGIGAWRTIIRTEPLFQDGHRRPTDLRDRMRTLHPERFPGRGKAFANPEVHGAKNAPSTFSSAKTNSKVIASRHRSSPNTASNAATRSDSTTISPLVLDTTGANRLVSASANTSRTTLTWQRPVEVPQRTPSSLPPQSHRRPKSQAPAHNQSEMPEQFTYTNLLPLPLETTQSQTQLHINPLVTWKPASGLF